MATKSTRYRFLFAFVTGLGLCTTLLCAPAAAQEIGVIQSYAGFIPQNAPHYANYLVRTLPEGSVVAGSELVERIIERFGRSPQSSSISPTALESLKQKLLRQIASGRRKFLEGEYQLAIKSLLTALNAVKKNAELLADSKKLRQSRRDASLYLAQSYLRMRRRKMAAGIMHDVIRLNPKRKISKKTYSPDLVKLHERIQRKMRRLPRHNLEVGVSVEAAIYVDGKYSGGSPTTIKGLFPGQYHIYAKGPKKQSVVHLVEISDRDRKLAIDLELENRIETERYVGLRFANRSEQQAEEHRRGTAIASALGLKKIIILRHEKYRGRSTLYGRLCNIDENTCQREGFVYLDLTDTPERNIRDLGRFLLNGEKATSIKKHNRLLAVKVKPKTVAAKPASFLKVFSWVSLGLAVAAAGASVPLFLLDEKGTCSSTTRCPEKYNTLGGGVALAATAGAAAVASSILFYYAYGSSDEKKAVTLSPRLGKEVGLDATFRF